MKFILYNLKTNYTNCDETRLYQVEDFCFDDDGSLDENYLCDYGLELARDNAETYGLLDEMDDDDDECDYFWEEHKLVEYNTKEDALEEYGTIYNF
jgi:hypothetical protein